MEWRSARIASLTRGRHPGWWTMRHLLRRYGSVNVPITSAGVVLYGLVLLVSPASSFTARVYTEGPFAVGPQRAWGIVFLAAGLLGICVRAAWGVLPLLVVVTAWTIALVMASVTVDGVAPTAGIGWSIICTQLLTSVALRGTNPSHSALHRGWRR